MDEAAFKSAFQEAWQPSKQRAMDTQARAWILQNIALNPHLPARDVELYCRSVAGISPLEPFI